MSHYIYQPHEFEAQVKKLPTVLKIKKNCLAQYTPKDRITFIRHLWETISANDGEIDLRLE